MSIASGMDVIFEKNNTGAVTKYVTANGMRLAKINPDGSVHYFLGDHLGSTRKVLDASRNTVFSADYEPFGKPYASSGTEAYKYTSEKHDDPTGLVYLRARQYDPDIGRFVSADPVLGTLAAPQTLNRYAYVVNNPLTSTDPSGMSQCNPQAGDQLDAACERWSDWEAFTSCVDSLDRGPVDWWTALDLVMMGVGIIPVFGDVVSTIYFLGRDVQQCLASGCDWVNIGLDALGFLPLVPALGGAVHLVRNARTASNVIGQEGVLRTLLRHADDISGIEVARGGSRVDVVLRGAKGLEVKTSLRLVDFSPRNQAQLLEHVNAWGPRNLIYEFYTPLGRRGVDPRFIAALEEWGVKYHFYRL